MTFNDHEGSTKSYAYTREHTLEVVAGRLRAAAQGDHEPSTTRARCASVTHARRQRGARSARSPRTTIRPIAISAYSYLREQQNKGQVVTGLLYVSEESKDLHDVNKTVPQPLTTVPYEQLTPGAAALAKLQKRYR